MDVTQVLLAPVVSEKSYALAEHSKYTFKVHPDAHKTQIRQAVEQLFEVHVEAVNIIKVNTDPNIKAGQPNVPQALADASGTLRVFGQSKDFLPNGGNGAVSPTASKFTSNVSASQIVFDDPNIQNQAAIRAALSSPP